MADYLFILARQLSMSFKNLSHMRCYIRCWFHTNSAAACHVTSWRDQTHTQVWHAIKKKSKKVVSTFSEHSQPPFVCRVCVYIFMYIYVWNVHVCACVRVYVRLLVVLHCISRWVSCSRWSWYPQSWRWAWEAGVGVMPRWVTNGCHQRGVMWWYTAAVSTLTQHQQTGTRNSVELL